MCKKECGITITVVVQSYTHEDKMLFSFQTVFFSVETAPSLCCFPLVISSQASAPSQVISIIPTVTHELGFGPEPNQWDCFTKAFFPNAGCDVALPSYQTGDINTPRLETWKSTRPVKCLSSDLILSKHPGVTSVACTSMGVGCNNDILNVKLDHFLSALDHVYHPIWALKECFRCFKQNPCCLGRALQLPHRL